MLPRPLEAEVVDGSELDEVDDELEDDEFAPAALMINSAPVSMSEPVLLRH